MTERSNPSSAVKWALDLGRDLARYQHACRAKWSGGVVTEEFRSLVFAAKENVATDLRVLRSFH